MRRIAVILMFGMTGAFSAEQATPPVKPSRSAEAAFPAIEALEREIASLVEVARPSVVGVIARSRMEDLLHPLGHEVRIEGHFEGLLENGAGGPMARRLGSGVVIDSKGHVVTLASVVSGATEISVISSTGQRLDAKVRGLDDESGIAVLVLDQPGSLSPIRFGDSDMLKPGSLVTTFSSSMDDPGGPPAYSMGFVTGTGVSPGPLRRGSYLKLSAHSAPGAGGGPVLDSQGRLAGIVFGGGGEGDPSTAAIRWIERSPRPGKAPRQPAPPAEPDDDVIPPDIATHLLTALHRSWSSGSGVSYAVPGNVVRRISEELIRSGSVRRGWVGVRIEEVEPGQVDLLAVVPGSPAEIAGLRTGDRIVSYGIGPGKPQSVSSSALLVDRIASAAPGATLTLGIVRGRTEKTVQVVLGETPRATRTRHGDSGRGEFRAPRLRIGRPVLGVELDQETSKEQRRALGSRDEIGLLVLKVHEPSRAREAGMRPGDLIIEAMGLRIDTLDALREALRVQGDRAMPVKVIRERRELVLTVPPVPAPLPPPPAPAPPPR